MPHVTIPLDATLPLDDTLPFDEKERLALLHSLNLLDSPGDPAFDRITRLATRALDVPIALVSLIDADRQWFKSCVGLEVNETPREYAFCAHAILKQDPLIVADARLDDRFVNNPLVTGSPNIRFYAGAPIFSKNGFPLGTLCIIDTQPRTLNTNEINILMDLAELVSEEIQQHEAFVFHLHNMADAIEESDARFRTMFELAAVGIALVAPGGTWLRVNSALCGIVGYSEEELISLTFQEITYAEDLSLDLSMRQQLADGEINGYQLEKRYVRKNGDIVWASLSVTKQVTADGELDYFVAIIEDIHARKEAEASLATLRRDLEQRVEARTLELRRANEMLSHSLAEQHRFEQNLLRREQELSAVLEYANDAYVCVDHAGVVSAWNRLAHETFGWSAEEAIGKRIDELIIPVAMREAHRLGMKHYLDTGVAKVLDKRLELPAIRKDGSSLPVEIRIRAIDIDGAKIFSAFLHDISERKHAEEIREREALHDALTGLPNRRALFELLPKAIERSNRGGKAMGILFLDLDDFKAVNDSLGHDAGDSLLKEIARRLRDCIRQTDTAIRLSGDEFTVVLENLTAGVDDALKVTEKLLSSISSPVQIGTEIAHVSVSIGIAIHKAGETIMADELLKLADKAMYTAKHGGKALIYVS